MSDTDDETLEIYSGHRDPDWNSLSEALRASRHFDRDWYIDTFPDVMASEIEPALHFVKYGAAMGRDPGPDLALTFWRAAHPQVSGQPVHEALGIFLDKMVASCESARAESVNTRHPQKNGFYRSLLRKICA